jgi:DNA repair photolyase
MTWKKDRIQLDNGIFADAQSPEIISVSRSTDIPAFYADWFFARLKKGYSAWTNPFNGVKSYVSYGNTRFIVFWSKNPEKLFPHLDYLKERCINCYIQYTLNDYDDERLEKGVPKVADRIRTFQKLVSILGKGRVIWRFDPLLLTDTIDINLLLSKIEGIAKQLVGYTDKLVFSFADILAYRRVKANLEASRINYREWTTPEMEQFATKLSDMNKQWGFTLATCGEKIDLEKYHISHNRCIDDDLMIRIAWKDPVLMSFLGVEIKERESGLFAEETIPDGAIMLDERHYALKKKNNKDKGQRQFCGCIISKDIGEYNTCPHLCEYCYANSSKESAIRNWQMHRMNPNADTITGK